MGISHFIKEIGRGKEGARHLSRVQAHALMSQVLDGKVSDLALGAFCVAMRIKGETAEEMAGFLDATHERLHLIPNPNSQPAVVLPSYNGSRRLPLLTPLLAMLLAKQGLAVVVHGGNTEDQRIATVDVMRHLGLPVWSSIAAVRPGQVVFVPTKVLHPGLWQLLEVRRSVGLRNPGHSLVKLMNPIQGRSIRVSSYTHPEYASSMRNTLALLKADALLLRGTEGEPVADHRRIPHMLALRQGEVQDDIRVPQGISEWLNLPTGLDAHETAELIHQIFHGQQAVPLPLQWQVQAIGCLANLPMTA
ncbi:MAG: DNA-binding protein YbiB [Betaproteobacteria bacterium]|nr:DNA-binding protein YbiB [Betaproteobacteria bacterium]